MQNTVSTTAIDPQAWAALQQRCAELEKENEALKVQGKEECQKPPTSQSIAIAILYKDLIQKNSELENLVKKMQSTDEKELKALNEALASRDLEINSLKQVNVVLQKNLNDKEAIHARLLSSSGKETEEFKKKLKSVEAKANLYLRAFKVFDEITKNILEKRAANIYLGQFIDCTQKGQNRADYDDVDYALFHGLTYECSQITALRQEVLATHRKEITL